MSRRHYELDTTVISVNGPLTLWKSKRGSVTIDEDTLSMAIKLDGKPEGYIFAGKGKLVLDTIVETEQGAIGKSVEKELTEPFLMLGNPQLIESRVSSAAVGEQKNFLAEAEDFYHRFFRERGALDFGYHGHHHEGSIFAFAFGCGSFDFLIPDGPKIVYKAKRLMFVSDEHRLVLKSPVGTVVSRNGRCVIVR